MPEVSAFVREAIAQILEWSAAAQVERRRAEANSPAFHKLNGAIAAYAKVLAVLTVLQRVEAFCATSEPTELRKTGTHERIDAVSNIKGPSHYVAEKVSRLRAAFS